MRNRDLIRAMQQALDVTRPELEHVLTCRYLLDAYDGDVPDPCQKENVSLAEVWAMPLEEQHKRGLYFAAWPPPF